MLDLPPATVNDFLATFKGLMDQAARQAPPEEEPVFLQRLRAHFGQEPTHLPILSEQFKRADHPNLHLALTAYATAEGRAHELYGLTMPNDHAGIRLVQLTQPEPNGWARPREAPVEYVNVPLQGEEVLACVQTGLYLIRDGGRPLAVLVRGPTSDGWRRTLGLDVMAAERMVAEAFLADLRHAMRARNVYRGHVI